MNRWKTDDPAERAAMLAQGVKNATMKEEADVEFANYLASEFLDHDQRPGARAAGVHRFIWKVLLQVGNR